MKWMDVDTALASVPVNAVHLIDDTDFKTREDGVVYNQAGLDLKWVFTTTAGVTTSTSVTPTTGGAYDWTNLGNGFYAIEIPASGGASINNDTEGFGHFEGYATGILPWVGPTIGFRAAGANNALIDAWSPTRGAAGTALPNAVADAAGGLPISDAGGLDMDALLVDPWATSIPGAYGAGTAGYILGTNLNAILTDRTLASAAYFDPATDTVKSDAIQIDGSTTAATNAKAVLTGTGAAADVDLEARSLTITNDTGTAVDITSSGGNGIGLSAQGHGTGSGIFAGAGATGNGLQAQGGQTSGDGARFAAAGAGDGLEAVGAGGGHDINGTLNTVGTPVSLDSGTATIAGMLAKLADDNGGASYIASTDSQRQIALALGNISTGSAGINTIATSGTIVTTGSETLTYTATHELDMSYHEIAPVGGVIEMYYEFNIGANSAPVSATWQGYVTTNNDNIDVYAYNWAAADWDQIGTIAGTISIDRRNETFDYTSAHVGTGANAGLVRLRFESSGADVATNLATDQILTSYTNINQSVGYADGAIWVDTNASNTNTQAYVDGVADNPVSTWAAALTLSSSLGIKRFHIINGSTITLSANSDNYTVLGLNWTLNLNSQSIVNAYFTGAIVSGTAVGSKYAFQQCSIGTVTVADGFFLDCAIASDITCSTAGSYYIENCFSVLAGTSAPSIDFGAAVGNTNLNFRHYSGGIEIKNMGQSGTDNMSLEGWGQYILNATCVGGTLAVRGHFKKTDNASGAVTLDLDANFQTDTLTGGLAQGAGTGNNQIQLATTASSSDGAYDPAVVVIISGAGAGQSRLILEYDGSTRTATVDRDWKSSPDVTSEYRIVANPGREHISEGLAQAGGSSTITLNALASSADDAYVGQTVLIRSGTGQDQAGLVTGYVGSTRVATVRDAWAVVPDTTSAYVMLTQLSPSETPEDIVDTLKASTGWGTLGTNTFQFIVASLLAHASGNIANNAPSYAYKDDDGSTTLYTINTTGANRTVT